MKIEKAASKRLKTIAIIGLITICSSITSNSIQPRAGSFFSRPSSSTSSTSNRNCFSRLLTRLGNLQLSFGGVRSAVNRVWKNFKGIFVRSNSSGSKTQNRTQHTVQEMLDNNLGGDDPLRDAFGRSLRFVTSSSDNIERVVLKDIIVK